MITPLVCVGSNPRLDDPAKDRILDIMTQTRIVQIPATPTGQFGNAPFRHPPSRLSVRWRSDVRGDADPSNNETRSERATKIYVLTLQKDWSSVLLLGNNATTKQTTFTSNAKKIARCSNDTYRQ